MKFLKAFNIFSTVMVVHVFFYATIRPACGDMQAVEAEGGIAVRQNVLLMHWPSGLDKQVYPSGSFGISETRTRLWSALYRGNTGLNIALDIHAGLISSDTATMGGYQGEGSILGQSRPLERWDLTKDHINESATSLKTRLDRLDVYLRLGAFDVDLGRQPLSLGTSHFVGVLDVVAPFAPGDLDATYKPGVDAVRIRRGIGMTAEAELIAVGARKWSDSAVLGRFRSSFRGIDLEFVGGRFRRRAFGGFGWEGGIGSLGIWGELALFQRRESIEQWRGGWSKAAFSGVMGIDVYLAGNSSIGGGVLFQDFGVRKPEDLMSVYNDAPYSEGWVFLGSASYGVVTVHHELHPLVQSDLAGLINLVDGSTLWQPRLTVNVGDNADMSIYGWIGTGKKAVLEGTSVSTNSEFGMLPDGGGFYARWFF